jgi:hypothetical protein
VTTDYWPSVCDLGTLDDDPHHGSTALAALENGDIDPEGLHTALVQSKVVRLTVRRLTGRRLGPAGAKLLDLLLASDAKERARHEAAEPITLPVLRLAAAMDAAVIKGLALRACYPDPAVRHLGDIDVHTPDLATGREFAAALRERGWAWDEAEFPWLKWDEDGICYGQLPLVYPDTATMVTRVDLHFGAFSVGHAGRLPMVGWERADVQGVGVRVPNRETAIALIAAHALGDTRLSMKDVNDLRVLIGAGVLDWSSVVELARTAHATDALGQLLAEVASAYPDRWYPTLPTEHRLRSGGLPGADRAAHFARHAEGDALARGADATVAAGLAAEAARYFDGDLRPRVSDAVPVTELRTGRNVCWRLLPEGVWADVAVDHPMPRTKVSDLGGGLELVSGELGSAVRIGRDVFVPTVWGEMHPESVRIARQVAGTG